MTSWTDQHRLGDLIKSVVFEQNLIDPKDCNKQRIAALKKSVSIFSAVDNNLFFTVFRRAASEYLLAKDLDAVEFMRASSTPAHPQTYQAFAPAAPPAQTEAKQASSAPALLNGKQVDKPNTMLSSSVHAHLHVVSPWVDEKQNDRVHVLISICICMACRKNECQ
jgi:hypothetical protein